MFDNLTASILPLAVFFFFCSTIGCIGNFIMILSTFVSSRLRSPCHFLISVTCLIDAFHIAGQFPFCYQLVAGTTVTQSECYFILTLPIVGYTAGGPLLLAMGIDRFIAVKYPTNYRYYQQAPVKYILIQLIFPFFYTSIFLIYGFLERDFNTRITCANPLALNGPAFQWYNYTGAFIYVSISVIYFIVYMLLKHNKTSSRFKKVFRSILVTVSFVLFGWMTTTIANAASYSVTDDVQVAHLIQTYAGITVNVAAASNFFVFYAINTEYRLVVNSIFCKTTNDVTHHQDNSTTQEVLTRSSRSKSVISVMTRRMTLI